MLKLTAAQASFLHDEPNLAVVAVLRPDGSVHQTPIWIDYDGEHVLLNLNNFRAKLDHLRRNPRISVLVVDRNDPFRWLGVEGTVAEITTEGAYEHIVRQAGVYLGRNSYRLGDGEQRILVRITPSRVESRNV